jgi:hypothetical protein
MIKYPISQENKNHELNTINEMLTNNHYQRITNVHQQYKSQRKQHTTPKRKKEKWATLTNYGPETRIITRPFKNTNIGVAFKTNKTIKKPSKTKKPNS